MTDWTSGYVADIDYTYGYYPELNPERARFALHHVGLAAPHFESACELGFGQGVSVNIHAAASSTRWFGTDFNPAQAGFAQQLARASGSCVVLTDDAFSEFANRTDLPDFDFIGLHGIWSWISDENRKVLVDFIRRRLKVGGVVYVSYNTLPGWAAMMPIRHLMTQHAAIEGTQGQGVANRITAALAFAGKVMDAKPAFARAHPQVADRLQRMQGQNLHYMAHEYFNRDWHPMYFSQVLEQLGAAKLDFAASAHLPDHFDQINVTREHAEVMATISDPMFKQTLRDMMVNQQFRRDLWVKGARKLSSNERDRALRATRVVLTTPVKLIQRSIQTPLGKATLAPAVVEPLLDTLKDFKARSLGDLEQQLCRDSIRFQNLTEVVALLMGTGQLAVAREEAQVAACRATVGKLNQYITRMSEDTGDVSVVASAVTGGGVSLGRFQQMFLRSVHEGCEEPTEMARRVWSVLVRQGQRILKDGKPLPDEASNQEELRSQAQVFLEDMLPGCRALGIVLSED